MDTNPEIVKVKNPDPDEERLKNAKLPLITRAYNFVMANLEMIRNVWLRMFIIVAFACTLRMALFLVKYGPDIADPKAFPTYPPHPTFPPTPSFPH